MEPVALSPAQLDQVAATVWGELVAKNDKLFRPYEGRDEQGKVSVRNLCRQAFRSEYVKICGNPEFNSFFTQRCKELAAHPPTPPAPAPEPERPARLRKAGKADA